MALIFQLYKREQTPEEKYIEFKVNERNRHGRAIRGLFLAPTLFAKLNILRLFHLHFKLLKFYWLEKLFICHPRKFLIYYNFQKMFHRMSSNYKFHKNLLNLSEYSSKLPKFSSLLVTFEKFLQPIQNFPLIPIQDEITIRRPALNGLRVWKSAGFWYYMHYKNSASHIHLEHKGSLEMQTNKYHLREFREAELVEKNLYLVNHINSVMYLENFLWNSQCTTPYAYIEMDKYSEVLRNLNLDEFIVEELLALGLQHNNNLKILNIPVSFMDLNNLKLDYLKSNKLNSDVYWEIKTLEEQKIFRELHLYLEFNLKTILNLIEILLFKFKEFIDDLDLLLQAVYNSKHDSLKFMEFYNLFVEKIRLVKKSFNLYTIEFLTDCLEFFQFLVHGFEGCVLLLDMTINNFYKTYGVNLRLFQLNFYKRIELFRVNDNSLYEDYYRGNLNLDIKITHSDLIKVLKKTFIKKNKHLRNLSDLMSYELLYFFFKYIYRTRIFLAFRRIPKRYRRYKYSKRRFVKFIKKKISHLNSLLTVFKKSHNFIQTYMSNKYFKFYYLNLYAYINIFKLNERRYKKRTLVAFLAKKNTNKLKSNILGVQQEVFRYLEKKLGLQLKMVTNGFNTTQNFDYTLLNFTSLYNNLELLNTFEDSTVKRLGKKEKKKKDELVDYGDDNS